MNRICVRPVVLFIALAFAAAPALTRAADADEKKIEGTVHVITVINDQEFTIGGKTYPMEQLAQRLKSAGAKADSEIRVQIPRETPLPTLKNLTTTLMMAGYSKFFFVKPRHAESIPGK
jgi:biopolymer transport protein ExbD